MRDWLNTTHVGDCHALLKEMAADGVRAHTCITSPPYFGLRDYGVDGQIGLEPTPAEYVERLVEVFRAVWDVLVDDGTLWLNLGDSYANDGKWGGHTGGKHAKVLHVSPIGRNKRYTGLKPKDLLGIPWRVAFALQSDGWYLRSDIIWHKPNPMPESVTDRPTKAHEYLFLLAKSERYYYDIDAIREPDGAHDHPRNVLHAPEPTGGLMAPHRGIRSLDGRNGAGRNKRSVWTIPTQPFCGAHFATFPRALIEPCILAGCPAGGVVLDPFMGSGTTGQVATDFGRKFIGCELNPAYIELHNMRRATTGLPF